MLTFVVNKMSVICNISYHKLGQNLVMGASEWHNQIDWKFYPISPQIPKLLWDDSPSKQKTVKATNVEVCVFRISKTSMMHYSKNI